MKRLTFTICIVLILYLTLPFVAYGKSYLVDDLTFLPTEDCRLKLHYTIRDAKESIYIVMYTIVPSHATAEPILGLIKDLAAAQKRGVKVKVILDDLSGKYRKRENEPAYKLLSQKGIDVTYDTKDITTHTKLVVVDEYITIVGSQNWSISAFTFNADSSVLIKSKEVAKEFLRHIASIKTKKAIFSSKELAALRSAISTKSIIFRDVSTIIPTEENATIHFQMGYNYYQNRMYDKAIQEFKKAIEIEPKHTQARYYLNLCYKELGQKD